MQCQNCGEHEANIRYTQIVNGAKKELNLCSKCAEKLGLDEMNFSLPIDFSSFFGEFLENNNTDLFQEYLPKQVHCEQCGMTLEEFSEIGKFGCANCYEVFCDQINPLLKNIQGADTHVGRGVSKNVRGELKKRSKEEFTREENKIENKIEQLRQQLKQAIQVENYEKAAQIRDEIKKWEEEKG